jgi:hypothetical protein
MKWVTRENVKVDRVACPWLIRRFVDPEAEFMFVGEERLLEAARRENAVAFDAPRIKGVPLNHRGKCCTFEAIVSDYKLYDQGLTQLGLIVRAADVRGQERVAKEGTGLKAIAHGFASLGISDHERLAKMFPLYDALLEYEQRVRRNVPTICVRYW